MATFQHFYELTTATILPNFVVITNIYSKPKLKSFEKKILEKFISKGGPLGILQKKPSARDRDEKHRHFSSSI